MVGDRMGASVVSGAVTTAVAPLSDAVGVLLARGDAELRSACLTDVPEERFDHAHLAAMRVGAAVLAARGRPSGRRMPRSVWDLVDGVAPELCLWTAVFAARAPLRAGVESGRARVSPECAEHAIACAEGFACAVRELLGLAGGGSFLPVP
jgi:hypothetical protein